MAAAFAAEAGVFGIGHASLHQARRDYICLYLTFLSPEDSKEHQQAVRELQTIMRLSNQEFHDFLFKDDAAYPTRDVASLDDVGNPLNKAVRGRFVRLRESDAGHEKWANERFFADEEAKKWFQRIKNNTYDRFPVAASTESVTLSREDLSTRASAYNEIVTTILEMGNTDFSENLRVLLRQCGITSQLIGFNLEEGSSLRTPTQQLQQDIEKDLNAMCTFIAKHKHGSTSTQACANKLMVFMPKKPTLGDRIAAARRDLPSSLSRSWSKIASAFWKGRQKEGKRVTVINPLNSI